jgi:hypothetical protein
LATSFPNLSGDTLLVCPLKPHQGRPDHPMYASIGPFSRKATHQQRVGLWRRVAQTMSRDLWDRHPDLPVFVSTSGEGVPWLHVRLSAQPKYYKAF